MANTPDTKTPWTAIITGGLIGSLIVNSIMHEWSTPPWAWYVITLLVIIIWRQRR